MEGEHRKAAWKVMLDHVPALERPRVVQAMGDAVQAWQRYRDAVAAACGVTESMLAGATKASA